MTTASNLTQAGSPATHRYPLVPVFRRSLVDSWRSLIVWSLGVAATLMLYLPLYPSMKSEQMTEMVDNLPPELIRAFGYDNITTGAGYTQATFYGLVGFALLTIASVAWASSAIAGAEESGRLELVLAHGVGRVQYALESAAAILVKLLWLVVLAGAVVLAFNGPSELDLEPAHVVGVSVATFGLMALVAAVGLAVGAITGKRSLTTGTTAGLAVASYAVNAVANQTEDLNWLHRFTPYSWAFDGDPLANGVDGLDLALLWGFATLFTTVAVIALRRRDVTG